MNTYETHKEALNICPVEQTTIAVLADPSIVAAKAAINNLSDLFDKALDCGDEAAADKYHKEAYDIVTFGNFGDDGAERLYKLLEFSF